MEEIIDIGKVKKVNKKKNIHVPSKIYPDTLFTFCSKLEYIESPIKTKMISPRYCEEDVKYLKIPNIKRIEFPMKCFCDINMHQIEEHLSWYGYYGLALTKEWGIRNNIQSVQYINENSKLKEDFKTAFSKALKIDKNSQTKNEEIMKDYLLHQLMYFKPIYGKMKNRNTGKKVEKCFTDECEWRFVPNVSSIGYRQVYYDEKIINDGRLDKISLSLLENPEISLKFDYEDLKYIIINTKDDFGKLSNFINSLNIDIKEKENLFSKIIIWELSGGDF